MTRLALAMLVATVAGACGDNLPDPATARSGDRLKLIWYDYPDGTRQRDLTAFYDSAIEERCTPMAWSDGGRYCAPAADEAVYVTETCTRALGRTLAGATPAPFFATRFYLHGEPLPSRVFRRGEPAMAPIKLWHKHPDGCIDANDAIDDYDYYELGTEITSLPQLRRDKPRGDGDLALVDELSDDGMRVAVAFFDRTVGVECTPEQRANAADVPCVPDDAALASYFHEVGCLEPEVAIEGVAPLTAKQYSPQTRCWSYYDVGVDVPAPPLYEAIGGTCISVAPPAGARFFVMAGPHQSQRLSRARELRPQQLARIELVRDELRIEDPLLHDQVRGVDCARDDQLRCVPVTDAEVKPFFGDSGCTQPLDLALVPEGDCDIVSPYARKGSDLYELVGRYTRQIYWLSTGDTCGTYAPPEPFVAYTLGAPVDPATFPTATLAIDP